MNKPLSFELVRDRDSMNPASSWSRLQSSVSCFHIRSGVVRDKYNEHCEIVDQKEELRESGDIYLEVVSITFDRYSPARVRFGIYRAF